MTDLVRRPTHRSEAGHLSVVLARAFHDDPVYRWAIPDPARRARTLPGLMRTLVTMHAGMGPTEVAEAGGHVVGVAVWDDPGRVSPRPRRQLRALPGLVRAVGSRLPGFGELGAALERARPGVPHHYLFHLGTDPGWWGHGVGAALLGPALAAADARDEPAYLETRPENVGFYERFGFRVDQEIPFPELTLLAMSRLPRGLGRGQPLE